MPFIVTVSTPETDHYTATVSLEDARRVAFAAIDASGPDRRSLNSDEQRADHFLRCDVRTLTDAGGWIGSLYNGGEITVKPISGYALLQQIPSFPPGTRPKRDDVDRASSSDTGYVARIVAAWNETIGSPLAAQGN